MEALGLYQRIQEPFSIGYAYWRLGHVSETAEEQRRHRKAAADAWLSVGRDDLVAQHLSDLAPPPPDAAGNSGSQSRG